MTYYFKIFNGKFRKNLFEILETWLLEQGITRRTILFKILKLGPWAQLEGASNFRSLLNKTVHLSSSVTKITTLSIIVPLKNYRANEGLSIYPVCNGKLKRNGSLSIFVRKMDSLCSLGVVQMETVSVG